VRKMVQEEIGKSGHAERDIKVGYDAHRHMGGAERTPVKPQW